MWYTSHLRQYDAGVMELGLEYTDKMAIPPGQDSYTLTGYCLPQCTAVVCNIETMIFQFLFDSFIHEKESTENGNHHFRVTTSHSPAGL